MSAAAAAAAMHDPQKLWRSDTCSNSFNPVRKVAIVGGTHGNELNGVYLARHFGDRSMDMMVDSSVDSSSSGSGGDGDDTAAGRYHANNPLTTEGGVKKNNFSLQVIEANRAAVRKCRRYVEEDLNRCFLHSDLTNDELVTPGAPGYTLERVRARQLNDMLGPKGAAEPNCDFIIDLHNTTSSSDVALMMARDDHFSHEVAVHLMKHADQQRDLVSEFPTVRIVHWDDKPDHPYLPSLGRSGMTFEVGPCPTGCLVGTLYQATQELVRVALEFIQRHNQIILAAAATTTTVAPPQPKGTTLVTTPSTTTTTPHDIVATRAYERVCMINYPRTATTGELKAMVHPDVQGHDFSPLLSGTPLFLGFDGRAMGHYYPEDYNAIEESSGDTSVLVPLFVNEAAYYEKDIAMALVRDTAINFVRHKAKDQAGSSDTTCVDSR